MPGLFGVETPEDVRARIGKAGNEQDLNLAALPAGRGAVALASKLGRGAVAGAGQLLGAESPEQKRGNTNELIKNSIQSEATNLGITREKNPIEYLGLTSKVLLTHGETAAASNALKMAGTMDRLKNLPATALETNVRQIYKLNKYEPLPAKARVFMGRILAMQSTPSGVLPTQAGATSGDIKKSGTYLKNAMSSDNPVLLETEGGGEPVPFTLNDMEPANKKAFRLAHAEGVTFAQKSNKQKGASALSDSALNQLVFDGMTKFLKPTGDNDYLPFNEGVVFDERAYQEFLDEQGVGTVSQDSLNNLLPIGEL